MRTATAAVAMMMLGALILRVWLGRGLPLWLDESWTGMIATQPDMASFWREAWLDCNPPLYYGLMALWTGVAGASDIALRLPSLAFVTLAAALPLGWRVPGLTPAARIGWALLLALWAPGFELAVDARGYGLLLFLSVAQMLAFIGLMAAPGRGCATLWASLAALAGLTHYHALLIGGLQGLALLWHHRAAAVRLWPAAIAFAPCFGWLALHAPRLADYARPDIAWYEPMTPGLAAGFVRYGFGVPSNWGALALLALMLALPLMARTRARLSAAQPNFWHLAAALSLIGLGAELGLSTLKPMLTDRYLVSLAPGLLLGLVLAAQRWGKGTIGLVALVALYAAMLNPLALRAKLEAKTRYGFAEASAFLADSGATRLVFIWDHPAARILDPGSLAKLGGFFLRRDGHPLPVTPAVLLPGSQSNRALRARTGDRAAIIWVYNRARISAARTHPPVPQLWPGRRCFWSHSRWVGTFACGPVRNPSPSR
ncbi:MAG: hypothetical protein ACKOXK_00505 [Chakrabartia sp.]